MHFSELEQLSGEEGVAMEDDDQDGDNAHSASGSSTLRSAGAGAAVSDDRGASDGSGSGPVGLGHTERERPGASSSKAEPWQQVPGKGEKRLRRAAAAAKAPADAPRTERGSRKANEARADAAGIQQHDDAQAAPGKPHAAKENGTDRSRGKWSTAPRGQLSAARDAVGIAEGGKRGGRDSGAGGKQAPRVPTFHAAPEAPSLDGAVPLPTAVCDIFVTVKGTNAAPPLSTTAFPSSAARALNALRYCGEIGAIYATIFIASPLVPLHAVVPLASGDSTVTPVALRFASYEHASAALTALHANTPPNWTIESTAPTTAEGAGAPKRTDASASCANFVAYSLDSALDLDPKLRQHILSVLAGGAPINCAFVPNLMRGVTGVFVGTPLELTEHLTSFFDVNRGGNTIQFRSTGRVDGLNFFFLNIRCLF